MNDTVEQRLSRLTPRGVQPELRGKVLKAVARVGEKCEPPPKTDSPWLRRAATAVAASLLLGIGLSVWASKTSDRRLARLFGPPPVSKGAMEIAKTVGDMTDAETGQWVYRQLTMPPPPGAVAAAYAKYCDRLKRLIDKLQTVSKDSYYETPQESPEMDRDRAGRIGGDSTDCQRRLRLDYRYTA